MMLELKGRTKTGEWVKFEASDICRADKTYMIVWTGYAPYYEMLLTETIQLAEDPRKAMLDEIKTKLKNLRWWSHFEDFKDLALVSLADVEEILHEHEITVILDELEAKL